MCRAPRSKIGVHGIQAEAVEVELLEPHPDVVQHVVAHRVAAVAVVIDRGAPRGLVPIVEVSAELAQVVPLRAEVVVDDVEIDRQPLGMAGVDQPMQALRAAVAVLRRVGEHAVVSPVARARELADRHDLDGRDAQLAEVAQPRDHSFERPLGGERADVQLVEDQVLAADPLPAGVGPGEPIGPYDGRRPVDALRLPERAGVGSFGAAVEPEGIAPALGHVRLLVAVVAARLRLHGDLTPRRAVDQDQAYPLRGGCPDPEEDRPVRRSHRAAPPRRPALLGLVHGRLRFASSIPGPPAQGTLREVPARRRLVFVGDSRPRLPRSRSAGDRVLARRAWPLITPVVALVGRGAPGPHRVLREVPHGAGPRAGGTAADRAEDRIPQATAAHDAPARFGRSWVLHDRSAFLTRPARPTRARDRVPSRGRGPTRRRCISPTADSFPVTFVPCSDPRRTGRVTPCCLPNAGDEPENAQVRRPRKPRAVSLMIFSMYASRMPKDAGGSAPIRNRVGSRRLGIDFSRAAGYDGSQSRRDRTGRLDGRRAMADESHEVERSETQASPVDREIRGRRPVRRAGGPGPSAPRPHPERPASVPDVLCLRDGRRLVGGLGPTLFALALGYLAGDWFFIPPHIRLLRLERGEHRDVLLRRARRSPSSPR